jgi:amino acid transporter
VGVSGVSKRILLGRKLRSTQLGETLLPKRIALPVFASDALSSVAYAPDEVFIMLGVAGVAAYAWSWKIALGVALVMLTVVASYRQTVHAYPSGGGDYEVATVNLGRRAGMTVASALLVDYVLTVAVSISSGAQYASAALPEIQDHEVLVAVIMVAVLAALNLRGVRESGTFFAVPTYLFMAAILGMCGWGFLRMFAGALPDVESADLTILPQQGWDQPLTTVALIFLLARAFSSGCAALTGVEAISNGVPAFRKPKSRNAATTLLLLGLIAVTMMVSVIVLAKQMGLKYVDPHELERLRTATGERLPADYDQRVVIAQIAHAVFSDFRPGFYFVVAMTGIVLVLAANTAFNGFPVLGSILAQDGLAPRQLGSRGDRLAYSNGILFLAVMAAILIVAFKAQPTRLIQLYIVGVFVSFNLSQLGMIRHWTRHLKTTTDPQERRRMMRSRAINTFGLGMTAVVLVIVVITKFLAGAWITILAMGAFYAIMDGISRHYQKVADELLVADEDQILPTRVHAIVLVSKVHKPTMRAVAYAKAARPNLLEAVMVDTDPRVTARVAKQRVERELDKPRPGDVRRGVIGDKEKDRTP